MAIQLCATEAGNTQDLSRQSNANLSKTKPKADSTDQPILSLKEKIAQRYTKWATKKGEQLVKNGWG